MADIKKFGDLGVDVFLILSGIGLYYLASNLRSDTDNIETFKWGLYFYKNRLIRIMPATIICLFPWYLYLYRGKHVSVFRCILDVTSLSYWIDGNNRGWYISLTIALYSIYPIIFFLIKSCKKKWLIAIVIIVIDIVLNTLIAVVCPRWFEAVNLALCRIPVFILGCFIAPTVKQQKRLRPCGLIIYLFLTVFLFCVLNNNIEDFKEYGIWRNMYGILAFGLSLLLSVAFHFIHGTWITRVFDFFGKYTLELYLTHTQILTVFVLELNGIFSLNMINLLAILCSVMVAILIHGILLWTTKRVVKKECDVKE